MGWNSVSEVLRDRAGGCFAAVLAIILGLEKLEWIDAYFAKLAQNNPFYTGPNADWLSLIPFAALVIFLYLVGREKVLKPRKV